MRPYTIGGSVKQVMALSFEAGDDFLFLFLIFRQVGDCIEEAEDDSAVDG